MSPEAENGQSAGTVDQEVLETPGQSAGEKKIPAGNENGQSAENEKVSRADFEKLQAQLSAADKRRAEYEQKLKEIEDKDKSEFELTQSKLQEREQTVQTLTNQILDLRLENAFLKDTSFTWHDPSDVLRFLENDETVNIDENGKVQGMQAALKKLAETKPYLIKDATPRPTTPSGDPSNSGAKGSGIAESTLRSKYAALRK